MAERSRKAERRFAIVPLVCLSAIGSDGWLEQRK
jgi:hypothetical protein